MPKKKKLPGIFYAFSILVIITIISYFVLLYGLTEEATSQRAYADVGYVFGFIGSVITGLLSTMLYIEQ